MKIIEELELIRRGVYCDAISYPSFTVAVDTSTVIRAFLIKDGRMHLGAGGAIVGNSDPAAEYRETLIKGRAVSDALGLTIMERW